MNPLQLLIILRAHWKAAFLVLLLGIAAGYAANKFLPKRYTTTASVVFDVKQQDPIAGMMFSISPFYLATQVEIIKSDRVTHKVIRNLKLDENPVVRGQWMAATGGRGKLLPWLSNLLQKGLSVNTASGSSIINISYSAGDPAFAAFIANGFAQAYIDANIELKVDPARQYARWFEEQSKALRDKLEKAQSRLSAFQRKKGIVARDEQMDTEMAKLVALTTQLTEAQGQTADAQSKQISGADTLLEVMQNPVVSELKSAIAKKEATLQEMAGNLGNNHPQYRRMEAEIAALKEQLALQTARVTRSFSTAREVSKTKEAELREAIEAQKKKLLKLKDERDQLAVLQRDVDAAKHAYTTITQRLTQTTLESQVTQANAAVLTPAVEPLKPSFPKPMSVMLLMGAAVGGLLGLTLAFALEMLSRRIRSVDDLSDMLQLPVLAVIERSKGKKLPAPQSVPALALR